jgi:hypothetical protein
MGGVALALGLDRSWFRDHLTADPLILFRIFRYPPETRIETPNPGPLGRRERVHLHRHLRRLPVGQGRQGLPRPQGPHLGPMSSTPASPRVAAFLAAEALSAIGSWATIVAIWG